MASLAEYAGRQVRKQFDEGNGRKRTYEGVVSFLGERHRPYCFKVTYSDGDTETMTLKEVLRHLVPLVSAAGAKQPQSASKKRQVEQDSDQGAGAEPLAKKQRHQEQQQRQRSGGKEQQGGAVEKRKPGRPRKHPLPSVQEEGKARNAAAVEEADNNSQGFNLVGRLPGSARHQEQHLQRGPREPDVSVGSKRDELEDEDEDSGGEEERSEPPPPPPLQQAAGVKRKPGRPGKKPGPEAPQPQLSEASSSPVDSDVEILSVPEKRKRGRPPKRSLLENQRHAEGHVGQRGQGREGQLEEADEEEDDEEEEEEEPSERRGAGQRGGQQLQPQQPDKRKVGRPRKHLPEQQPQPAGGGGQGVQEGGGQPGKGPEEQQDRELEEQGSGPSEGPGQSDGPEERGLGGEQEQQGLGGEQEQQAAPPKRKPGRPRKDPQPERDQPDRSGPPAGGVPEGPPKRKPGRPPNGPPAGQGQGAGQGGQAKPQREAHGGEVKRKPGRPKKHPPPGEQVAAGSSRNEQVQHQDEEGNQSQGVVQVPPAPPQQQQLAGGRFGGTQAAGPAAAKAPQSVAQPLAQPPAQQDAPQQTPAAQRKPEAPGKHMDTPEAEAVLALLAVAGAGPNGAPKASAVVKGTGGAAAAGHATAAGTAPTVGPGAAAEAGGSSLQRTEAAADGHANGQAGEGPGDRAAAVGTPGKGQGQGASGFGAGQGPGGQAPKAPRSPLPPSSPANSAAVLKAAKEHYMREWSGLFREALQEQQEDDAKCVHDACTRAGEILGSKTLDTFIGALDAALHFFKHDYQPANPRDAHFNLKLIAFSQLVRFRAITMLVRPVE